MWSLKYYLKLISWHLGKRRRLLLSIIIVTLVIFSFGLFLSLDYLFVSRVKTALENFTTKYPLTFKLVKTDLLAQAIVIEDVSYGARWHIARVTISVQTNPLTSNFKKVTALTLKGVTIHETSRTPKAQKATALGDRVFDSLQAKASEIFSDDKIPVTVLDFKHPRLQLSKVKGQISYAKPSVRLHLSHVIIDNRWSLRNVAVKLGRSKNGTWQVKLRQKTKGQIVVDFALNYDSSDDSPRKLAGKLSLKGKPKFFQKDLNGMSWDGVRVKFTVDRFKEKDEETSYPFRLDLEAIHPKWFHSFVSDSRVDVGYASLNIQGNYHSETNSLLIANSRLKVGSSKKSNFSSDLSAEIVLPKHPSKIPPQAKISVAIKENSCQNLASILPKGTDSLFSQVQFSGSWAFEASFALTHQQEARALDYDINRLSFPCTIISGDPKLQRAFLDQPKNILDMLIQRHGDSAAMHYTPIQQISRHLVNTAVASEDLGFWHHKGIDINAMMAAMKKNLQEERVVAGGSTITMQTVKNLYLNSKRNLMRKIQEVILAHNLERQIDKHKILEIYLNIIEFGPGVYGITNAARHFFDKTPAELGIRESVYLIGLLPSPKRRYAYFCKRQTSAWYRQYMNDLLARMFKLGIIIKHEYDYGLQETITFAERFSNSTQCFSYRQRFITAKSIQETP